MSRLCRATLISVALMSCPCDAADIYGDSLAAMRRIDAEIVSPAEKVPLLQNALGQLMRVVDRSGFDSLSDEQVRDIYDAALMAAYYSHDAAATNTMRHAWDVLDRRGQTSAGLADEMVSVYVASRMFSEAKSFARLHKERVTAKPPAFADLRLRRTQGTALAVSANGSQLTRREVPVSQGAVVVVVGSPSCYFSRLATEAIEHDTELGPVMTKHAIWLIPQSVIRDFGTISRWNEIHPGARFSLIYRQEEWSFLASSATPTFYFLKDGKLVSTVVGWPGPEQKDALRAALAGVGIADATSPARN